MESNLLVETATATHVDRVYSGLS